MANTNSQYAGRKLAIAAAVAALLGTEAYAAPAGSVDFSIGNVVATGADGRSRQLAKGAELNSGDRIVTNDGRAQIRFADGAYVSLQPNTDFAIREFRYEGRTDGSERGIFGLLKGAMRTVTGAIGRVNRAAYEIQTPTATIGIRGTGGLVQVFDDGRTLLVGTSGVWTLAGLDKKNVIDLPAGQAAMTFPDPSKRPEKVSEGPVLPPPPLLPVGEQSPTILGGAGSPPMVPIAGNFTTESGGPAGLGPIGPFEIAYAFLGGAAAPVTGIGAIPATTSSVVFDGSGAPVEFKDSASNLSLALNTAAGGVNADYGTVAGIVSWGRWVGPVLKDGSPFFTFGSAEGLHYALGIPTPVTDITSGTGIVTFSLAGGTTPTNGSATGTLDSGSMMSLSLGGAPKVGIDLKFTMPNGTYQVQTTGGIANPGLSQVSVAPGGPYSPFAGASIPVTGTPTFVCSFGCSAKVNGHFHGAGATHASFVYEVTQPGPTINGAAAFQR